MKKNISLIFFAVCLTTFSFGRVGIGAGGGLNYPGLISSDLFDSKFTIGAGYDIFIRHKLIKLSDKFQLNAKYCVSNYFSDIDLARVGNTRFNFSYLSVEMFTKIHSVDSISITTGAGLNLVNATAIQNYFESNESLLIPTILIGMEYKIHKNYNIFSNLNFQFGEFEDNNQNLPIYGFRFQVGATMFLTE